MNAAQFFFLQVATLRNKNLATLNEEGQEEHPSNNLLRDRNVPGTNEEYITQDLEEIDRQVIKNLS